MKPGSIIPTRVASLKSLTVTMAVMSYLACLAIGALILVDRAVTSWTSSLSTEMTVQIRHTRAGDIEQEVEKARALLGEFPGITVSMCWTRTKVRGCSNRGSVRARSKACRCRA